MERVPHRRRIREQTRGKHYVSPCVHRYPPSELKWVHDVVRCGSTGRSRGADRSGAFSRQANRKRERERETIESRRVSARPPRDSSKLLIKTSEIRMIDRSGARSSERSFRIIEGLRVARSCTYVQFRRALPVAGTASGSTFTPRGIAPLGTRIDASAASRNSAA
jgi:hypothetical protein